MGLATIGCNNFHKLNVCPTNLEAEQNITIFLGCALEQVSPQNQLMRPLVSVVVPVYNRPDLVSQVIGSLLRQTEPRWEAVVVDDGSTDNTLERVTEFASLDSRIRPLRRNAHPKGAPSCRNIGTEASQGDYIIYLDSDDVLSPTCIEERLRTAAQLPDGFVPVFLGEMFTKTEGDSQMIWNHIEQDYERQFFRGDPAWQTAGPLWPIGALKTVGPWNVTLPSWQDWEFHCRAISRSIVFKNSGYVDYFIRNDPDNKSITNTLDGFTNRRNILKAIDATAETEIRHWSPNNTHFRLQNLSALCCRTILHSDMQADSEATAYALETIEKHRLQPEMLTLALRFICRNPPSVTNVVLENILNRLFGAYLIPASSPFIRKTPKSILDGDFREFESWKRSESFFDFSTTKATTNLTSARLAHYLLSGDLAAFIRLVFSHIKRLVKSTQN